MIRKAEKSGLQYQQLNIHEHIDLFRQLYKQTMDKNNASDFFYYDDRYYESMLALAPEHLQLHGVFNNSLCVSMALVLMRNDCALYHLAAGLPGFNKLGAGNLLLYEIAKALIPRGVRWLNLGGGRTTAPDDSLYRFKAANANSRRMFRIGKRVIDPDRFQTLVDLWLAAHPDQELPTPFLVYRC